MHFHRSQLLLFLAIMALLAPVLPAFAQNGGDFDYRFEGIVVTKDTDASSPMLIVDSGQVSFQTAGEQQLDLMGVVRCAGSDPACLGGRLEGQAVTVTLANATGLVAITDGTSNTMMFYDILISSLTASGHSFGSFSARGRGSLACAGQPCQTLNFQMVACSTGGDHQLGVVLNGSLAAPMALSRLIEEEGIHWLTWNSLSGTAHLSRPGSPNPICGGRDLDVLFADDYLPQDLPGRTADMPAVEVPEDESARVDRDIVIESTNARKDDNGITYGVRGYFFGRCGVEPQVLVRDDADIVAITIYRAIPDGMTCTGGLQSFSFLLPYVEQDNMFKAGDRFPVNVNGQIIAILIG